MKFSSKNDGASFVSGRAFRVSRSAIRNTREKAFSLVETVAALMILAFMSTSVLVIINNYMASAADSVMRMQAFEVVRNNMETLLTSSSLEESVEYGTSEIYPDIQWETSVEMFYEPLNAKMWIQAICSAEYTDSEGEVQTIELAHWLTDLTKAQSQQILAQQEREREMLAGEIIETLEANHEFHANIEGESPLSSGIAYQFMHDLTKPRGDAYISGIFHVGPFTCMQEGVATAKIEAMAKELRKSKPDLVFPIIHAFFGDSANSSLDSEIAVFAEQCYQKREMLKEEYGHRAASAKAGGGIAVVSVPAAKSSAEYAGKDA